MEENTPEKKVDETTPTVEPSPQKEEISINERQLAETVKILKTEVYSLRVNMKRMSDEIKKLRENQNTGSSTPSAPVSSYKKRVILFGNYPYGMDGEVKPIEWVVLDEEVDGTLLLVTKHCVDFGYYLPINKAYRVIYPHPKVQNYYWESSLIREWLNDHFYNTAFNEIEKTHLVRHTFLTFGIERVLRMESDNVFLLSTDQMARYMSLELSDPAARDENKNVRKAYPTPYVIHKVARESMKSDASQYYMLSDKIYDNSGDFVIRIDQNRLVNGYPARVAVLYNPKKQI